MREYAQARRGGFYREPGATDYPALVEIARLLDQRSTVTTREVGDIMRRHGCPRPNGPLDVARILTLAGCYRGDNRQAEPQRTPRVDKPRVERPRVDKPRVDDPRVDEPGGLLAVRRRLALAGVPARPAAGLSRQPNSGGNWQRIFGT